MKIGFIGGGAMAEAITRGIVGKKLVQPQDVYLSDHKAERCTYLHDTYGVQAMVGAEPFLSQLDLLFLAVKPQVAAKAMEEVKGKLQPSALVVSIVAGLSLEVLEKYFSGMAVVRVMPNTPLAVGEGMSAIALGHSVTKEGEEAILRLLSAAGKAIVIKESMMDAVTGLSGSGPAYAFLVLDALSDGGVAAGLPRTAATTLAAQTLLGAAKMVLETKEHPMQLRDQVTSPAGTTIEGVRILEEKGVRGALIDAVLAAANKSKAMGNA